VVSRSLPDREHPARATLAVALGLLGRAPAFRTVVVDTGSVDITRAWILGVVLARWVTATAELDERVGLMSDGAQRVAETALRRLQGGHRIPAVE